MPRVLLDIAITTIQDALRIAKRGLTDAYATYQTPAGKTLNAFENDNLLFAFGEYLARLIAQFEATMVVAASEATPFGATGANLDRWLALKGVSVPSEQQAQVTIDVTGQNNATLPAGSFLSSPSGARYSTDAVVNFPAPLTTISVNATAEEVGSRPNVALGDVMDLDPVTNVSVTASVGAILQVGADPADESSKGELLEASFVGDTGSGTEGWYQLLLRQLDGAIGDVLSLPAGFGVGSLVLYPLLALTASEAQTTTWLLKKPTAGQTSAWQTALRGKRTVNDRIYVVVLTVPVIDIVATISPNDASTQAAATEAMHRRFAESYSVSGYSIANSEILGALTTATGVFSATINNITAGTDADENNVPVPGAAADVYALPGQAIYPSVSFL